LVLAQQGKALEILQNIPETKQGDYYSLTNALKLRYRTKHLTPMYQSQLKSRLQGPSETLQEFGTEVRRLTRLAYPQAPEECLNQIAVQTFIDGVKGAVLQLAFRLGRFNNLTDALVYSLKFKVAKNISHKKDSEPDSKFPGDQYQTGDVAVME